MDMCRPRLALILGQTLKTERETRVREGGMLRTGSQHLTVELLALRKAAVFVHFLSVCGLVCASVCVSVLACV